MSFFLRLQLISVKKNSIGSQMVAVGYVGTAVVAHVVRSGDREPTVLFVIERGFKLNFTV